MKEGLTRTRKENRKKRISRKPRGVEVFWKVMEGTMQLGGIAAR